MTDEFFRLQEIFGGNAVSDEYGIGRHVANLFVTQTYEGQSDIHCEFSELDSVALTDRVISVDSWTSHHWDSGFLLIKHENVCRKHWKVISVADSSIAT